MSKLKTLLAMQLKEKLDLSFLHSKKQTIFKIVFSLLTFVGITAITYLIFWLCKFLGLFSIVGNIPISVIALVIAIIFVLNLFSCTVGLSKTLFYSNDNQLITTFPIETNKVYVSKIIVYFISEVKKTFAFLVPIVLAYGFSCKAPIVFYFWMPVMMTIFTAIPVLLGGLFAIPVNFVIGFFKKYTITKLVLTFLFLGGVVAGVIAIIGMIPSNIDLISSWVTVSKSIRAVLAWTVTYLSPFYIFAIFTCGEVSSMGVNFFTSYSWIVPLVMIGIIGVLVVLNYYTSRPFYLKLISRQFEFKRRQIKIQKQNKKLNSFWATSFYEAKKLVRDTNILSTTVLTIIIAPIAVLLLNKIYAAINTRLLGDFMTIAFNILMILMFVLAHNINVSSIYSRDGEAFRIGKTAPSKSFSFLISRLFYNFITTSVILVATSISFFNFSNLGTGTCTLIFFMLLFVSFAHILWSADIDFCNPQIELFRNEGALATNPNEIKSTVLMFLLSLVFAGISIFLLTDGLRFVWIKVFLVAFALFVSRLIIFARKAKAIYREA